MQILVSPEDTAYLKSPIKHFGFFALLVGVNSYGRFTDTFPYSYPYATLVTLLLISAIVAILMQKPRYVVYLILLTALAIYLLVFVHVIANGPQDVDCNRDEAVENTARALMRGENAWNAHPGVAITTGPTSILLAIPFVIVFGKINWLTFVFWTIFFLVLLSCDVRYRNNSWPTLTLVFMLGLFDIGHTMFWSLEELYYPILYLALSYVLITLQHPRWAGALLAASVLTRPSYLFLVMGFGLWYLFSPAMDLRKVAQMSLGFLLGIIVILLPFLIIGGNDLWVDNPWRWAYSFSGATWPETNFIFRTLNQVNARIGPDFMRWIKLGLTLLIMTGIAWRLRLANIRHPFWHITAGAFIAHTLVWLPPPKVPKDYTLIFVLPAMLAIAMTPTRTTEPIQKSDLSTPSTKPG